MTVVGFSRTEADGLNHQMSATFVHTAGVQVQLIVIDRPHRSTLIQSAFISLTKQCCHVTDFNPISVD